MSTTEDTTILKLDIPSLDLMQSELETMSNTLSTYSETINKLASLGDSIENKTDLILTEELQNQITKLQENIAKIQTDVDERVLKDQYTILSALAESNRINIKTLGLIIASKLDVADKQYFMDELEKMKVIVEKNADLVDNFNMKIANFIVNGDSTDFVKLEDYNELVNRVDQIENNITNP